MNKQLIYGMATNLPGVIKLKKIITGKGTGGTDNARYCYSVWLRHLVMAKLNNLNVFPKVVAEIGPGDSLGIGLAAMISGVEKYNAFDIVEYSNIETNLDIFDELVKLFKERTPIPGEDEFPEVKPFLNKYSFPDDILSEDKLEYCLSKPRLDKIRKSIENINLNNSQIQYKVPWNKMDIIEKESVDMIYSQAVLEHVDDLKGVYEAMYLWLNPTGFISHEIDFKCHGTASEWNGHWTHSDLKWKLIKGKRPYLINREPRSKHIELLGKTGFEIICEHPSYGKSNINKRELAPKYKHLSDEDLSTCTSFIQAVKKTF